MERGRFAEVIGRGLNSAKDFIIAKPVAVPLSTASVVASSAVGLIFHQSIADALIISGMGVMIGGTVLGRDIIDFKASSKSTHRGTE